MPRYPNSECDAHRNVKTSAPVCIVCMDEELTRLRKLAQASLDARDKEAKAAMSYECAKDNYTDCCKEATDYERAMLAASRADAALRAELTTPNAELRGGPAVSSPERPA